MPRASWCPPASLKPRKQTPLILALGQEVDLRCWRAFPGYGSTRRGGAGRREPLTDVPGLFAGGDMVPSERTVTIATGHGKKAARHMDAWLRGRLYHKPLSYSLVGAGAVATLVPDPRARQQPAGQNRRGRGTTLARSSAGWMRWQPATRRRVVTLRQLSLSATAAMAAAPSRPSPSWGRVWGIRWMPSAAIGCGACHDHALVTPSSCANRRSPK